MERRIFYLQPNIIECSERLAINLYHSLIFLYGGYGTTDCIVKRWSYQLRKKGYIAEYAVLPDVAIEETLINISDIELKKKILLLIDRTSDDRILKKFDRFRTIAIEKDIEVMELYGYGKSKLSKLISLCYLIDFINAYLSILENIKNNQE